MSDPASSEFTIDPRLIADTHPIGSLPGAVLLLHRDAGVPWFIVVPVTRLQQFFELNESAQHQLLAVARDVARYIVDDLAHPRINLATLGNVVPQLHWHVIGRRHGDPCWPKPVWGNLSGGNAYPADEVVKIRGDLTRRLGLTPASVHETVE